MTGITATVFGGLAAIAAWALVVAPGEFESAGATRASGSIGVTVDRSARTDRLSPARSIARSKPVSSETAPEAQESPATLSGCTSALGALVRQQPRHWIGTCFAQLTLR